MSVAALQKIEKSYEDMPYENYTFAHTHPDRISVTARLFGLTPPDYKTARVLELGCASGSNLIPQALAWPKASFLGLDLSANQIAEANKQKEALGLKNVEFRQQDILTFDTKAHKGKFDYVICHGVLSWVPDEVRDRIFGIFGEVLSPTGIVLVSYNALPGWGALRSLREMMLYHTGRFDKARDQVGQARGLVDFLADNVPQGDPAYHTFLKTTQANLKKSSDSYIYHDYLEAVNTPYYLTEVVSRANAQGLDYLGDSKLFNMFVGNMPPKVQAELKNIKDVVVQEQYMDFIYNQRFRSSLFCRKEQKINRMLRDEQIMEFCMAPHFEIAVNPADPKALICKAETGANFMTTDPGMIALVQELAAAGAKPVTAEAVIAGAQKRMKPVGDAAALRKTLVQNGIQFALRGFIALHAEAPQCVTTVSKKPQAFALARWQAAQPRCAMVINVVDVFLPTDAVSNLIIANLDGTKTTADIADIFVARTRSGDITLNDNGKPVTAEKDVKKLLEKVLADLLPKLAENHLLVG